MHDESQVNTMDLLDDVSNPNINDGVRELTSDSEVFPCVLSEEDAVVDPRKAAEEIINDSQGAESGGVNGNAMDGVNDMVPCNGKRPRKPPRWTVYTTKDTEHLWDTCTGSKKTSGTTTCAGPKLAFGYDTLMMSSQYGKERKRT
ncbi:hypothetical protein NDU88_005577 [Pleurodeles waltl]|uniref:Uncharacterized protein n=1 Tax=Pleurodeles waltl TaxID=8319 RepID=A0AAV7UKI8_PLEWA|nr:hypothetical protein NDU88_005577 [Pleurodeles waltl]